MQNFLNLNSRLKMEIKRVNLVLIILFLSTSVNILIAQDTTTTNTDTTAPTTTDSNSEQLTNESVSQSPEGLSKIVTNLASDFEQAGRWFGFMFSDYGWAQVARRRGYGVVGDVNLREKLGVENSSYTLGLKVNFSRVYYSYAEIIPPQDIRMYGKVKKITVWAFGKNTRHRLFAEIRDARGAIYKAPFRSSRDETLNFENWQKLEAIIPEDNQYKYRSNIKKRRVIQEDNTVNRFYNPEGIKFRKFVVEFDARDTEGLFYLFLDQLEYVSDVYHYEKFRESLAVPINEIAFPLENW